MVKSKRKKSTSRSGGVLSTKKRQKENNNPSVFDQLCDESLLNILSYTDDLRSLIYLTRCTSKSLRRRFDPKPQGGNNEDGDTTPEYSEQCTKTFWQGVFADLCMTPLEDSDSKSHNYVAAINYRLSLFNTLIQSDKRKKATGNNATKRSTYSLPLCHHNLKPLADSWDFGDEDDSDDDSTIPMINPFALLSKGTGKEYVIVDPDLSSVDVHKSIMEDAECLDKAVQKKRGKIKAASFATKFEAASKRRLNLLIGVGRGDNEDFSDDDESSSDGDLAVGVGETMPSQVLLNSYHHSIKKERVYSRAQTLICQESDDDNEQEWWDEYFGDNTPFGPNQIQLYFGDNAPFGPRPLIQHGNSVYATGLAVETFNSMDDARILLKEKRILLRRLVRDDEGRNCTEFIIWGDAGCKERAPSKRFELKSMIRIPTEVVYEAFSLNGDKLYCLMDEDIYRCAYPDDPGKVVYQFSLSSSDNVDDETNYVWQQECFFVAENNVASLHPIGLNHMLVGTEVGTIELWDISSDKTWDYGPYLVKTFDATDAFPDANVIDNSVETLMIGQEVLQNSFVSVQECSGRGTVISFWQSELNQGQDIGEAEFQLVEKIIYDCEVNICLNGHSLIVLSHDKFGCLYLDIYHILGSRFVLMEFDNVNLPKNVEMTNLHARGEQRVKFANRINIRQRLFLDDFDSSPEHFALDMNDRFIVVSANNGLIGSNGETKTGPGLIVIDLDDHTVSP